MVSRRHMSYFWLTLCSHLWMLTMWGPFVSGKISNSNVPKLRGFLYSDVGDVCGNLGAPCAQMQELCVIGKGMLWPVKWGWWWELLTGKQKSLTGVSCFVRCVLGLCQWFFLILLSLSFFLFAEAEIQYIRILLAFIGLILIMIFCFVWIR